MRLFPAALALFALAAPAHAQEDYIGFQSPTGNIHCMIWAGDYPGARCDMKELTPSYRRAPAHCDLDWGSSFSVEAGGPGILTCHGDTVIDPRAPVLGYGRSVTLGPISCQSEKSGMTCTNPQGRGFTISKAKQRLY